MFARQGEGGDIAVIGGEKAAFVMGLDAGWSRKKAWTGVNGGVSGGVVQGTLLALMKNIAFSGPIADKD